MPTLLYTAAGTVSWTVPPGVTKATVEIGGGGGGAGGDTPGGDGGASSFGDLPSVPGGERGLQYTVTDRNGDGGTAPAGGTDGEDGATLANGRTQGGASGAPSDSDLAAYGRGADGVLAATPNLYHGAGGGGAYLRRVDVPLVPGSTIAIVVGAGGAAGLFGLNAGTPGAVRVTYTEPAPRAIRIALDVAAPVAEVEALPAALRAALNVAAPAAEVEALPGALRAALGPAVPIAEVEALPELLRIALRPGSPTAGTTAHPATLRIALRPAQPLPLFDTRPGAVHIALRPAAPRGRTRARPGDLEIAVRLGNAVAYREAAAAALGAALDMAVPIAHVEAFAQALRAVLRPTAPAADVEALAQALRATLRSGTPAGIATGRAAALGSALRPGVPAATVAAFPRTLAAVLRPGPPRAIPWSGEPADRGRSHARALVGRDQTFALEIEHPAIAEPVRVVADTVEHAVEGNRYVPLAFHARVPQAKEGEIRTAVLRIDNVGRELMQWVEASQGGRDASMRVLRLIPPAEGETGSTVAWEVEMSVGVAEVTNEYVTVSLTDEPVFGRPAVILRHDPATSPGLF